MSERLFNTDKVEQYIGIPGKNDYNKIELFTDQANPNNIWGLVYYTVYERRKPVVKCDFVVFRSHYEMMDYLNSHFDCYELNHPVDIRNKKIFFHFITYNYDLLDDKNDKKYFVVNYYEHSNGPIVSRSIPFPKEYKREFIDILRYSKGLAPLPRSKENRKLYSNNDENHISRDYVSKYTSTIGDKLYKSGAKLKNIKKDPHRKEQVIHKLKVFVSTAVLASLLAGGYVLTDYHIKNSEYVTQVDAVSNLKDLDLFLNKDNMGVLINALMEERYSDVTLEELQNVISYIGKLVAANYDKNGSFNSFNFENYYSYKLLGRDNYVESTELLKKIENMYKDSFYVGDGEVHLIRDNAIKYIDYVCSLTFMYDSYHNERVKSYADVGNTDNIFSTRATTLEISTYDSFPSILKYTILTQLKGMISKVDYQVKDKPLYYFKDTNRDSILLAIEKQRDSVLDRLYFDCGVNYRHNGL